METLYVTQELQYTPEDHLRSTARVFDIEIGELSDLPQRIIEAIQEFRAQAERLQAIMQHNEHAKHPIKEGFYYNIDKFTLEEWVRLRVLAIFDLQEKDDPQIRMLRCFSKVVKDKKMGILQSIIDLALIGIPRSVSFLDDPETAIERSIAAFEEIGRASGTTRADIERELAEEDALIEELRAA